MTNNINYRKEVSNVGLQQEEVREMIGTSRGRPVGTVKRPISEGVSHSRLNIIRDAILKMDPAEPRIWSQRGRPKTAYLQKMTGITDLAQWEIAKAYPGLNRANATATKLDISNLTLHQGGWRFQMRRGTEYIRRNLGTPDLERARRMRDWYCISGNWDCPDHIFQSVEA
jgi:hypothetical protein